jgi:hypothetical protein
MCLFKTTLITRGASLKLKGKIYSACVRSDMIYGSETWSMRVEDKQRMERTERMMVRHMCDVTLKEKKSGRFERTIGDRECQMLQEEAD